METLCHNTFANDTKVEMLTVFAKPGRWLAAFVAPRTPAQLYPQKPVSPDQDEYERGGYAGI
jgi:hypothetical protein